MQYIVKGISLLQTIDDFENLIVGYKAVRAETEQVSNSWKWRLFTLKMLQLYRKENKKPTILFILMASVVLGLLFTKKQNTIL